MALLIQMLGRCSIHSILLWYSTKDVNRGHNYLFFLCSALVMGTGIMVTIRDCGLCMANDSAGE